MTINKKKGKGKAENPEHVSNVMREIYQCQLELIYRKIDRRRKWQKQWQQAIPDTEDAIKKTKEIEAEKVKQLEEELERIQNETTEQRNLDKQLEKEIIVEKESHEQKVANDQAKGDQESTQLLAELTELDEHLTALTDFKANKAELNLELEQRERQLLIAQDEHVINLSKLNEMREKQRNYIKAHTLREVERMTRQLENDKAMEDSDEAEIFQKNFKQREDYEYIRAQIEEMQTKIPETAEQIRHIKSLAAEKEMDLKKLLENMTEIAEKTPSSKLPTQTRPDKMTQTILGSTDELPTEKTVVLYKNTSTSELNDSRQENKHQLTAILKEACKIVCEAQALHVIPEGGLPEEARQTDQVRADNYHRRRDFVLDQKAQALRYLLGILSHRHDVDEIEEKAENERFGSKSVSTLNNEAESSETATSSEDRSVALRRTSSTSYPLPESDYGSQILRGLSQLSFYQYHWSLDEDDFLQPGEQ